MVSQAEDGSWVTEHPCRDVPNEVVDELQNLFPVKKVLARTLLNQLLLLSGFPPRIDDRCFEMEICFLGSGYYTPASMYGGPDHLGWPEEGEDERILDGLVDVSCDDSPTKKLSKAASQAMFDLMEEEIYQEEVSSNDYRDYDGFNHEDY
jgi:hypothetical protein